MTTTTTGIEFKRFYGDRAFWPQGGKTYHDDTLFVVDGRPLREEEDPADIPDRVILEIRSGFVIGIPQGVAGGVEEMDLGEYFLLWQKTQSTVTLVLECPRDALDQVIAVATRAGARVPQA